jgi:glycosyltransferase involved in cell wall biosynthesis
MRSLEGCIPQLRIWHIAETYPPQYGGGAAIGLQEICRRLARRGHEVRVLCTEKVEQAAYTIRTDYDGQVRVDRVNLPYFRTKDPDGCQLGILRWRKHQRRIGELIHQQLSVWRPDLVHYHTCRPLGEECLVAIHRQHVPVVAMLHDAWLVCARLMLLRSPTSEPCGGPSPLRCLECLYSHYDGSHLRAALKLPWRVMKLGAYPAYRLWRRRVARQCVAAANGVSQFTREAHHPHINGTVRHIIYPFDSGGRPRPQRGFPLKAPIRFGFVAGFQPHKGIEDVLHAAVSLKRSGLPFELHIWGPHQEQGAAEIAARLLEDRVFLRGMYAAEERWGIYEEMDVAIMATKVCEPLGRVPIEAAAAGAPTIAPAVGGITETIRDGVDGLLYRFRDPQDLERQMRRVIEEPGLLERLSENVAPPSRAEENILALEDFYCAALGLTPAPAAVALV